MRSYLSQGSWALRLALASAAGIIFLAILFRSVSFDAVAALVGRAKLSLFLFGLLLFLLDLLVRCVRFAIMLEKAANVRIGSRAVAGPYIASLGISDILPLRAGDAFRVIWLQRRFKLGMGPLMSALLLERIADLVALLMIGGAAISLSGSGTSPAAREIIGAIFLLATLAALILVSAPGLLKRALSRWFANSRISEKLISGLASVEAAVRQMSRPANLLVILCLSLIAWTLEAFVMLSVWAGLGGRPPVSLAPLLAFSFSALGTAVPSLPGHFGSFELAGFYGFHLVGTDPSLAAATLLATHLILWAPTAVFAIIWLSVGSAPSRSGKKIEQCEGSAP